MHGPIVRATDVKLAAAAKTGWIAVDERIVLIFNRKLLSFLIHIFALSTRDYLSFEMLFLTNLTFNLSLNEF